MKNDPEDKGWQELEARLERLHRRYLDSTATTIDYRPGEILQMFELSSPHVETRGQ